MKKSRLTVAHLRRLSRTPYFKRSIQERSSELGGVRYVGFTMDTKIGSSEYFNFCFVVEGAFSKKINKRPEYLEILQVEITDEFKKFFNLYNKQPVKIFSSDPSFKYYIAYALTKRNAVIINPATVKHLGKSLTRPAIRNNPRNKLMMNKHFYFLTKFIRSDSILQYMSKKYLLDKDKFTFLWKKYVSMD